jgi:PAS domain-containing protein
VFENRVLRKIFGLKRDEMTGEWKRLRNEELYDLYSAPNIIRVIKSRRMRGLEHVTRLTEKKGPAVFWWRDLRERNH